MILADYQKYGIPYQSVGVTNTHTATLGKQPTRFACKPPKSLDEPLLRKEPYRACGGSKMGLVRF